MNNFIYPAIFTPDLEVGGYVVTFPDLSGIITEGDDVKEALAMAKEALGSYIEMCVDDGEALPPPTAPDKIRAPEGGFISLIEVDLLHFKLQYSNKAVKKTLTIPEWLNSMAEARKINFSAVLKKGLRKELGI
jgi:predicted RNase H-like HicB family nuclease